MTEASSPILFRCVKCGQVLRALRPSVPSSVSCTKCALGYSVFPDGQVTRMTSTPDLAGLPPAVVVAAPPARAKDFHLYKPVQVNAGPVQVDVAPRVTGPVQTSTSTGGRGGISGRTLLKVLLVLGLGFSLLGLLAAVAVVLWIREAA